MHWTASFTCLCLVGVDSAGEGKENTLANVSAGRSSLQVTARFSRPLGTATAAEAAVRRRVTEAMKLTMMTVEEAATNRGLDWDWNDGGKEEQNICVGTEPFLCFKSKGIRARRIHLPIVCVHSAYPIRLLLTLDWAIYD